MFEDDVAMTGYHVCGGNNQLVKTVGEIGNRPIHTWVAWLHIQSNRKSDLEV